MIYTIRSSFPIALLLLAISAPSPTQAQISLGTAESFGVLGGSAVTSTGATVVTGNLGISPGSALTGFPPGLVVPPGAIHIADAVAAQAQADTTAAYNAILATPTLVDLTGTDLGGLTLTPGVYGFASSAQLTGVLSLDTLGNPDAVFIFKIASTLTTASGASVQLVNGGSACKIFWQIGSSATLGSTTNLLGNVIAFTSITLNTNASISGRALARNGAVTMSGANTVTVCPPAVACPSISLSPATLPAGMVGSAYNQIVTASGSSALPYTYSVSSGALPGGLLLGSGSGAITGVPTTPGTFIFTITATDTNGCFGSQVYTIQIAAIGCPPILLSPSTLPSGLLGSPYNQVVTASGGTSPYTYSVSSGSLPTGLLLDGGTGAITGIPIVAGIFNFTITAIDSLGCPGSLPYTISIAACPIITLSPPTLPEPEVGVPYSEFVSASGGAPPYTYAVTSGALPAGLLLDSSTGEIFGIATTEEMANFIITATDTNGCTGLMGYNMQTVLITTVVPTLSGWGQLALMLVIGLTALVFLVKRP